MVCTALTIVTINCCTRTRFVALFFNGKDVREIYRFYSIGFFLHQIANMLAHAEKESSVEMHHCTRSEV